MVIVTAYSDRQTSAIADGVVDDLKRGHNERPLAREGQGSWTLLDYGDVIVHVFHEDVRAHPTHRLRTVHPRDDYLTFANRRGRRCSAPNISEAEHQPG